jgi:hypothetical protein
MCTFVSVSALSFGFMLSTEVFLKVLFVIISYVERVTAPRQLLETRGTH